MLQLVYVMRTGKVEIIFAISIIQSILSITNSMLNADNSYMTLSKWDKYEKRLPIQRYEFLQHGIIRLTEISPRIGLFAIFWTVVGGIYFSIITYNIKRYCSINDINDKHIDWHEVFLSLNIIFSLLPEWIFETNKINGSFVGHFKQSRKPSQNISEHTLGFALMFVIIVEILFDIFILMPLCGIFDCLRICFYHPLFSTRNHAYSNTPVLVSLIEWFIIIDYQYHDSNDNNYLIDIEYNYKMYKLQVIMIHCKNIKYIPQVIIINDSSDGSDDGLSSDEEWEVIKVVPITEQLTDKSYDEMGFDEEFPFGIKKLVELVVCFIFCF